MEGKSREYDRAVDDIAHIIESASDSMEAIGEVTRFIIKHKTGIDIAEMTSKS